MVSVHTGGSDFKVGDIVRWDEGSTWHRYEVWGKVTAVSKAGTLTVKRLDHKAGNTEFESIRKAKYGYKCELVPSHDIAMRKWHNALPKTKHLDASLGLPPYRDNGVTLRMDSADLSDETLADIASDLEAIRSWFKAKPVKL